MDCSAGNGVRAVMAPHSGIVGGPGVRVPEGGGVPALLLWASTVRSTLSRRSYCLQIHRRPLGFFPRRFPWF